MLDEVCIFKTNVNPGLTIYFSERVIVYPSKTRLWIPSSIPEANLKIRTNCEPNLLSTTLPHYSEHFDITTVQGLRLGGVRLGGVCKEGVACL